MAYVVSFFGILAAVGIMLVSAVMNARYAMSLGSEGLDRYLLAGGAVFADVGKALAWIFFATALAKRQVLPALSSLLMFLLCLGLAVSGSLGFIASQRTAATGAVATRSDTLKDLRAEKIRKDAQLEKFGIVDGVSVVTKRIEAAKQDARFSRSKDCTDATNADSRTFCAGLKNLEGDLAKSREVAKIEGEIAALRARMEGFGDVARNDTGDVQSALIAKVTGWKIWDIQLWLQLLVVGVIEAGACFMLYAAMNHGQSAWAARTRRTSQEPMAVPVATALDRPRLAAPSNDTTADDTAVVVVGNAQPEPTEATVEADEPTEAQGRVVTLPPRTTRAKRVGNVVDFMKDCCVFAPDEDSVVEQSTLIVAYQAWCSSQKCDAHDEATLDKMFDMICEQTQLTRKRHGDTVFWLGVTVAPTRKKRARRG